MQKFDPNPTPPQPVRAAHAAALAQAAQAAAPTQAPHALDAAVKQLAKLPILGPALWLYAKDPEKKTLFLADTASQAKPARILPPVILEQCQLFTKGEIPFAFITWALVNDEVDQRLRAGVAKIAPHEWQGGEHAWLVDVVSPFEKAEPYVKACCERFMAGRKVSRLVAGSESTRVEEVNGAAR